MFKKILIWCALCLLPLLLTADDTQSEKATLPQGVSESWWTQVQRNIAESEYSVSKAESILPGIGEALQAPNRK